MPLQYQNQFDRGQTPERITTMKITFTTNTSNTVYEANETMTYCWKFPFGEKGKRVRISKGEFLEAQAIYEQERKEALELKPAVLNEHGMVDCRECPVKGGCLHYNAMRRNPENVGGLGLCPRLKVIAEDQFEALIEQAEEDTKTEEAKEIAKKMAPKAKKARKSKDIAYKSTIVLADDKIADVTLTSKQVDFILHLSDTNFWENGLDSCIWVDILCDEIGGQFEGKPMTVGAMISTLCEKGLGTRGKDRVNGRKCTSFALTELGKKVAAEVGLK